MKTLDEVITALEICTSDKGGCEGCPYDIDCKPDKKWDDALHYLKEYQTTQMAYIKAMADLEDNPPLTWDELRQTEGKPVWVEFLNDEGKWNGEWCLIESSNDILCEILRCKMSWWGLRKITLGTTWQAYRKERTE